MSSTQSLKWPAAEADFPSCRLAAVVVLGLLSAAAAIITVRAWAGALQTPLEPAILLTAAVLTAAAAAFVRLGWLLPLGSNRIGRLDHGVMAVTLFAVAALCGGLCLPADTPPAAVLFFRAIVLVEESWAWLWFVRTRTRSGFSPNAGPPESPVCRTKTPDPFIAEEVTQQLTRSQAADGAEELAGWLRLPFAVGQRTGSVHVAFCPPLRVTPELAVEQIDGPEARIKTAQLLPYGARFDLKLAAAAEEDTSVLLQFSARTAGEK
jgi:hypothetical protein